MQLGTAEIIFEDAVENDLENQVKTLLSSVEGSFVCNRKFGIRPDIVDQPMQLAQSRYVADVHDKIELFIPQVMVNDITFRFENDTLYPIVYLATNENYEDITADDEREETDIGEEDEYERD